MQEKRPSFGCDLNPFNIDCNRNPLPVPGVPAELKTTDGMTVPAEKLEEIKKYTANMRRRFPHMKPDRLKRKVAEYFKIKLT